MLYESRVVHFWTRIWSGRRDALRFDSEVWDEDNTTNNHVCKTPGSDGETSNT